MARKVKCPFCTEMGDKEEMIYHNNRYYHKDCYDKIKQESNDYKELIAYICDLYKLSVPTGLILKQIKDFKEQYGYTYRGMKTTLDFFFSVEEGNEVIVETGVAIIPFVYDRAKKFYMDKINIKRSAEKINVELLENNKKSIHVKHSEKTSNYINNSLIDISSLE